MKTTMKRSDFKTEHDYRKHKANLKTTAQAVEAILLRKPYIQPYEKIVTEVRSYKNIKDGWRVNLGNGMSVNLRSQTCRVSEPVGNESVIITVNGNYYTIGWHNCRYESFKSHIDMDARMIGYGKYMKKFKSMPQ